MAEVEFVGQSAQNQENVQANTSRLVNWYREPAGAEARTSYTLQCVPATQAWKSLGALFVRDMRTIGRNLYLLNGGNLKQIAPSGAVTTLGSISSAAGGHLFGESAEVSLVSGGNYYVWDGSTLTQPEVTPLDPTTGNIGSGAYLNGYTILTERNSRTFVWSDILDATTFPGTNIATIEGTEDYILRVIAINSKLWFFKENSYEVWYLTGQAGANAFARIPGQVNNIGLKAANLVVVSRDAMLWIGSDDIAYLSDGQSNRPVSTPAVSKSIARSQIDRCFAYEKEGHKFFVIRFRDRPSWVLDLATTEWHERASGVELGPWTAVSSAYFNGSWRVATDTGEVYTLVQAYTDADGPLVSEATSSTLTQGGARFRIKQATIHGHMAPMDQSGIPGDDMVTALITDGYPEFIVDGPEVIDGDDVFDIVVNPEKSPKVEIAMSKDFGLSYGPYRTRSMGAVGQYDNRASFGPLGQFRQATMKVRMSDNARRSINSKMDLEIA